MYAAGTWGCPNLKRQEARGILRAYIDSRKEGNRNLKRQVARGTTRAPIDTKKEGKPKRKYAAGTRGCPNLNRQEARGMLR